MVFVINPTLNTRTDQPPTPTHNDDSTKMLLVVKADASILHPLVCYLLLLPPVVIQMLIKRFLECLHITAQK